MDSHERFERPQMLFDFCSVLCWAVSSKAKCELIKIKSVTFYSISLFRGRRSNKKHWHWHWHWWPIYDNDNLEYGSVYSKPSEEQFFHHPKHKWPNEQNLKFYGSNSTIVEIIPFNIRHGLNRLEFTGRQRQSISIFHYYSYFFGWFLFKLWVWWCLETRTPDGSFDNRFKSKSKRWILMSNSFKICANSTESEISWVFPMIRHSKNKKEMNINYTNLGQMATFGISNRPRLPKANSLLLWFYTIHSNLLYSLWILIVWPWGKGIRSSDQNGFSGKLGNSTVLSHWHSHSHSYFSFLFCFHVFLF